MSPPFFMANLMKAMRAVPCDLVEIILSLQIHLKKLNMYAGMKITRPIFSSLCKIYKTLSIPTYDKIRLRL